MLDKKKARLRRAARTRAKIARLNAIRLTVHRTNMHLYAQIIDSVGSYVIASASTVEKEIIGSVKNTSNMDAAKIVGQYIAERAKKLGISSVAFDRSGFAYHGRIKALAESARKFGLVF